MENAKSVDLEKKPTTINLPVGLIREIDALLRQRMGADYRPPRSLSYLIERILFEYYYLLAAELGVRPAQFVDGRGRLVKELVEGAYLEKSAQRIAALLETHKPKQKEDAP